MQNSPSTNRACWKSTVGAEAVWGMVAAVLGFPAVPGTRAEMNETEPEITVVYDGACPIRTLAVVCPCLLHALCRHTRASRVLLHLRQFLFEHPDGAACAQPASGRMAAR